LMVGITADATSWRRLFARQGRQTLVAGPT
jgi:hypothetical protein